MGNYTLKWIDEIRGKQKIFKLCIDGNCQFDEYEDEIIRQGQYVEEIGSIYSFIEDIANNKLLPKAKFRDITLTKKDRVKEYEFKTNHLRVYAIKTPEGKTIVFGGYKNSQPKDIRKFRSIKRAYIKTIKK